MNFMDIAPSSQHLDNFVVYVFLRQDVEVKHQIVQLAHAMRNAAQSFAVLKTAAAEHGKLEGEPFITVVGMPDAKSLDRVCLKLSGRYDFVPFHDTDFEFGVVAVVTEPMPLSVREKRNGLMCNYRLWNPANNTHPNDKYPPLMKGEV